MEGKHEEPPKTYPALRAALRFRLAAGHTFFMS
jgi:hypothetical protein